MKLSGPENIDTDLLALQTSPDRVWRKALLYSRKKKEPGRDPGDALLREACRFCRRWTDAGEEDFDVLMRAFPTLMPSYLLYQSTNPQKWLVEAALMTKNDRTELAQTIGTEPSRLERYSNLFFDVGSYLDSPAWVCLNVLRPLASLGGIAERDQDILFKILTYFYGWDALLQFMSSGKLSPEAESALQAGLRCKMLKNAWSAAHTIRVRDFNALQVIDSYYQIKTIEIEQGPEAGQDKYMKLVENLLSSCRMSVLGKNDVIPADEPRALGADGGYYIHVMPKAVKRLVGNTQ